MAYSFSTGPQKQTSGTRGHANICSIPALNPADNEKPRVPDGEQALVTFDPFADHRTSAHDVSQSSTTRSPTLIFTMWALNLTEFFAVDELTA